MITTDFKILIFCVFSIFALPICGQDAHASTITDQPTVRHFNIKMQALGTAILSFSEQSNIVVSVKKALTDGKMAPAVVGKMTAEQALARLFENSGLMYVVNKDGSTTILKASPASARASSSGRQQMRQGAFIEEPRQPRIEEILITATKRSERMHDVPIAITAFNARELESLRARDLADVSAAVPNMLMVPATGAGDVNISIRGLRGITGRSSGGAVGVYVDGVYQANLQTLNVGVVDFERIEVLKGPQGTLFGRDTIGGAVNITTKKPGTILSGRILAEYGNFNSRKLNASIDVPIIDNIVSARFTAQQEWEDGYVFNRFDGSKLGSKDRFNGRVQLYYTPSDQWDFRLNYSHLETDDIPATGEPLNNFQGDTIPYTTTINGKVSRKVNGESLSLSANYEFMSGYSLTSISSFNHTTDRVTQDTDFTSAAHLYEIFSGQGKEYSQEVRLTSPALDDFDYMIGGYFFRNVNDKLDVYEVDVDPYLQSLGFLPGYPFPENPVQDGQERNFITESIAAFVHGNYRVNEALSLFGGVRITSDKKKTEYSIFGSILPFLGFEPIDNFISKTSDTPVSWTLGARYHFNEDFMGYVTFSRGYRSGAIKDYFVKIEEVSSGTGFFSKPEYVTNYEAGFKVIGFDNELQANVAFFYMSYEDIISAIQTNGSFTSILVNASSAWIAGAELDLKYQVSSNLLMTASAGFLKSRYGNFIPLPDVDLTGQSLGNFPQWTLSSALDYSLPVQGGGTFTAHGDIAYKSSYLVLAGGLQHIDIGNYALVNASFGYLAADSRWKILLWTRNLFDTDAPAIGTNWNAGQGFLNDHFVLVYEHQRTVGATISFSF
ncbi:MAG: TonB-dependent receptor [Porticoccaceae bacterium]|nr:TonB-dependent receptor [Porticoccaceae bacterium]